jgi:hypothetical protein
MPKGGARKGAGRPKGAPNKSTAELKAYASTFTQEAIDTAVELMRSAESEATRIAAVSVVLDRAHGKPRQEIEHSGKIGGVHEMSEDELIAIASGSGAGNSATESGAKEPDRIH